MYSMVIFLDIVSIHIVLTLYFNLDLFYIGHVDEWFVQMLP